MENPKFLKDKYQLDKEPEVQAASKRAGIRSGEARRPDAEERVGQYLDRLKEIFEEKDVIRRSRLLEKFRSIVHEKFVIREGEIPESYFDSIKRKHREEGHGDIEIPEEYRHDLTQSIIGDQRKSLDRWFNYLSSPDDKHDMWLKYYAFRSILKMGRYDKEKKAFMKREKNSIAPFPELNREAIAIVLGDTKRYESGEEKLEFAKRYDIENSAKEKYRDALAGKNFPKLYALAVEEFNPIPEELLRITEGEWREFPAGSDPLPLVGSISEYGTGWCLRGEEMARRYLVRDENALHVYYSLDKKGRPKVPRAVMVVDAHGRIAEVRGVAAGENLDPYIGDVVEDKLGEPEFEREGKKFQKKSADMKYLTEIEKKVKRKEALFQDDLIFLYEIDAPIEGFGYGDERDPRIMELRGIRNAEEDMPIIFDCDPDLIAHSVNEITAETRAYVGPLESGIFQQLPESCEYIYTSFPEGKVTWKEIELKRAIRSGEGWIAELKRLGDQMSEYGKSMLRKPEFVVGEHSEMMRLIHVTVAGLGFHEGATYAQIVERAREFGLELCPPDVGPEYRAQYRNQPMGEWLRIAMEPIADSDGVPSLFSL